MDDDDIHDLIGSIYEASIDPSRWERVVSRLRVATKSGHAQLLCGTPHDNLETYVSSQPYLGFDNETASFSEMMKWGRYVLDTSITDPHVERFGLCKPASAFLGRELLPPEVYKRSPFYNDFSRHFGVFETVAGLIPDPAGVTYCIAVARAERDACYDDTEKQLLGVLLPHIQRSLSFHSSLQSANARVAVLQNSMDALTSAIVLLNQHGKVAFLNAAAARLIRRCRDLYVRRDRLCAQRHADTLQLKQLIRRVLGAGVKRAVGGAVTIQRASAAPPLQVMAAPVPTDCRASLVTGIGPVAMLVIHDPSEEVALPQEVASAMFGLTAAEARLILALSNGQTLKEFCDSSQVTQNTARTHLKSVFAKTGTKKQSDLVRLMSGLAHSVGARDR